MAFSNDSAQRSMATINVTPLVDVMLVLLVIFMITAPIATKVMSMPIGGDGSQGSRSEPIDLRVQASGEVLWNGNVTPLSALQNMMQSEVQRDPRSAPKLQIDASGDADYEIVAKVLAAAKNAGLEQIGFVRH